MAKILICYYSRSGNTKKMAYLIQKGVMEEDVEVDTKEVKDVRVDDLKDYDVLETFVFDGVINGEVFMFSFEVETFWTRASNTTASSRTRWAARSRRVRTSAVATRPRFYPSCRAF